MEKKIFLLVFNKLRNSKRLNLIQFFCFLQKKNIIIIKHYCSFDQTRIYHLLSKLVCGVMVCFVITIKDVKKQIIICKRKECLNYNRKRGWVGEILQVGFTSTETLSVSLIGSISFDATSDMSENVSWLV